MKRNHFLVLVGLALFVLLGFWLGQTLFPGGDQLSGKLIFDSSEFPTRDYPFGDFIIMWNAANGGQVTIEHKDRPGFALWQSIPGESFVMGAVGQETVAENRGMFTMKDQISVTCQDQTIDTFRYLEDSFPKVGFFVIAGDLKCSDGAMTPYQIALYYNTHTVESSNQLLFGPVIDIEDKVNRTFINFASNPDEHFFGFGEQFTYFDMKGKKVPIWVSEQGVGRGEQPITLAANLTNGGAGGNAFTTYAPLPFYISSQMRSFSIVNNESYSYPTYTSFDFRNSQRVQVETWAPRAYAIIRSGISPTEIIGLHTELNGRMEDLPDWVYTGAIVGMQGGTEKVQNVYDELKSRNTPIAAFWLQDWVGQRTTSFGKQLWWNWEVDYDRYPSWDEMVANFKENDIRVMVYASPYLADIDGLKPNMRRNLFQEAKENDYLVKNQNGEPYLILNTDFYFGMVDFTNPMAWEWYKSVIKDQVIGAGASGWMADFGEGLPYDAVLYDTQSEYRYPGEIHEMYPGFWAKLNREVLDGQQDDLVFFNRAAVIRSPVYASLFWEGDQLVDWSAEDGIKSAVTGLNTSGLSGMVFNHSDIGGYTTSSNPILNIHRSRELLYRWMEMNAFTLIFRTHEGNQPDKNVQFYTDDETLDTFAYWAKIYAALFDYRKQLVKEATETGLPVVRHPFIHYPDDPETWKITYQEFMLGADFLIAPVTDPDSTEVTIYLPEGRWVHLWTGTVYDGGKYITIAAPLGQPGVFFIEGSHAGQNFVASLKSQNLIP
jgi:alpha-glucosidase (family GH31 glycosyl hydrolase)